MNSSILLERWVCFWGSCGKICEVAILPLASPSLLFQDDSLSCEDEGLVVDSEAGNAIVAQSGVGMLYSSVKTRLEEVEARRRRGEDLKEEEDALSALACLLSPDSLWALILRKSRLEAVPAHLRSASRRQDLDLSRNVVKIHKKCGEAWAFRLQLVEEEEGGLRGEGAWESLMDEEFQLVTDVAEAHPFHYYAWRYACSLSNMVKKGKGMEHLDQVEGYKKILTLSRKIGNLQNNAMHFLGQQIDFGVLQENLQKIEQNFVDCKEVFETFLKFIAEKVEFLNAPLPLFVDSEAGWLGRFVFFKKVASFLSLLEVKNEEKKLRNAQNLLRILEESWGKVFPSVCEEEAHELLECFWCRRYSERMEEVIRRVRRRWGQEKH